MTPHSPSYIIVPAGELLAPHWQAIMRLPDGYKITCMAMLLRDMAVVCNAGGAICHPSGLPLTTPELAAVLGVDALWLAPVLRTVLAPAGIVAPEGDGWASIDPTLVRHYARLDQAGYIGQGEEPPVLDLEGEPPAETSPERRLRLGRNRKRRSDFRRRWGVEPQVRYRECDHGVTAALPEAVTLPVTLDAQPSVITAYPGAYHSIGCDSDGSTPSCAASRPDDGYPDDLTPLMTGIPLHEQPGLLNKIRACIVAGHTVHACHQAIDSALNGATNGQPPWGLAHHKLGQLAAAPLPVTPAPPPPPPTTVINARPDPTPEGLAMFQAIQNM